MPENKKSKSIFICSDCAGSGKLHGGKCFSCNGLGAVLSLAQFDPKLRDKLYYWGRDLSYLKIIQGRQQKQIRTVINLIFFLLGVLGFLSLIKVFFDLKSSGLEIHNFIYVKDEYALWWWI